MSLLVSKMDYTFMNIKFGLVGNGTKMKHTTPGREGALKFKKQRLIQSK